MKLKYEIGSFYEKEDIIEEYFSDGSVESFYDWLIKKGNYFFFESGRSAISAIINDIEKQTNIKVCLMPSYLCDTVVKPFVLKGWNIHFYQLDEKLEPKEKELKELVEKYQPSVIFTILYYGNDTIFKLRDYLKKWENNKEHFCVEDLTQSIFYFERLEEKRIKKMKYQIASLRKWFPISGGGMANLHRGVNYGFKEKPEYSKYQTMAQVMKKRYLIGEDVSKEEFLSMHRIAEEALDNRYDILPMDIDSYNAIRLINWKQIYKRRNKNAKILEKEINAISEIDSIFGFDKGAAPLYVPIMVSERKKLQEYMKKHNIFLPVLWPVPEEINAKLNESVHTLYSNMLAIPCDHRYTKKDMEYMIDVLKSFFTISK